MMKKFYAIALVAIMALSASAQVSKGDIAAGVNLLYGSEIESMGLGARFQYSPIDHLRGEVGINYFFKHNHTTWWDINLNAEWLFTLSENKLYIYPIAGLNYTMVKYSLNDFGEKISDEENHVGLNLGAGMEYEINEHFAVSLEYRHTIIRKVDQGVFAIGANYKF